MPAFVQDLCEVDLLRPRGRRRYELRDAVCWLGEIGFGGQISNEKTQAKPIGIQKLSNVACFQALEKLAAVLASNFHSFKLLQGIGICEKWL